MLTNFSIWYTVITTNKIRENALIQNGGVIRD